jgi:hypothetical protein
MPPPSAFNSDECQGYDEHLSGLDALNTDPTGFLLIGIHIQSQLFVLKNVIDLFMPYMKVF